MQLNEEQKKAAFCEENAVVAAGAGSGKTMVLANRFVWLLTDKGYKVNEILTLTFTKKAAAQMYKRIYSLVSEIAQTQQGEKSKRAQDALNNFINARIQTLDSYSASIVKQCSTRYGISPDFKIDQDRCYDLALEVSYPFFIEHRHHPAIEILYSDNRPNDIVHNIFADILLNYCNIDKPKDFISDVKLQFDIIYNELKKYNDEINKLLKEINNDLLENESLLPPLVPVMTKYKNDNINIPVDSDIQKYFDLLLNTPIESVIEKSQSHPLRNTLIKVLYSINSITSVSLVSGKRSDNPVKENIKHLRELFTPFSSLIISVIQAGFALSIMSLFNKLQNIYLTKKRSEGVLTFKDVASLSRTILIEQLDIRQSEKEAFKAIMIDEFQDNNDLQKDLLFLLAEKLEITNKKIPQAKDLSGGKLFFVGDEKQSIYLFRGADVSVFRKLKEEIKSGNLPLKTNYRSCSKLIGAFNTIFGGSGFSSDEKPQVPVFPSVFAPSDSLPLYEAGYTPLESGNNTDEDSSHGNLSICILNKASESSTETDTENEETLLSPDENEARFVAEKIKILLQKYKPHEIAVLFRTRSSQYLYEKHLRALGIPYTCEDINDLFFAGPVNDIMSVLRLIAHPIDKAAYAEMLRSPFAGLSLSGTAVCLSSINNNDNEKKVKFKPFDDLPLSNLDESDKEKYLIGRKIYSSIHEKAKTENICSLISELWYYEGYRYETEWNPQTSVYRELFDYLFHLAAAADADNQSLASFTDSMISFRDSGGKLSDVEIPLEHPSAVHLMTIHKSKGLEFPVVFLCSCGKKSQTDKKDIVYFSDAAGIAFSPPSPAECRSICGKRNNFFWEQTSEEVKRKRTAELRRLLYVGMTRAEKELYITGTLEIKETSETEDFSVQIKTHIENKQEKSENYIENDSILNNDTLFGLLLPAIVSHIPDEGLKTDSAFFNLEEIKHLTEEYIKSEDVKNTNTKNNQTGLNEFLQKVKPIYDKAQIITTPILRNNHITPVSLKNTEEENTTNDFLINKEFSGQKSDDIFSKVDLILSRFSKNDETNEKFNSGKFGTIAHICVEALLKKIEVIIPPNISSFLNPSQLTTLLDAGNELARRFLLSPLGKMAENAIFRENEFSFRSLVKKEDNTEVFINGNIDLFFEDNNTIHIVDFKTDANENPAEHTAQLSAYYHAVFNLFSAQNKKQTRVWLYYLRTGHAIEMTEKAKSFDLVKRAFEITNN
ncbi:MAG: UvrD-helicase domain-containing protein [Treponema sp.]|nr:UvrD-helicase domain-containing protein [Treponema sp.]